MATKTINVQKILRGMKYPASRSELVVQARRNGAEPEEIKVLQEIAETEYWSDVDVEYEIGKIK
jgi:hypothetical protein